MKKSVIILGILFVFCVSCDGAEEDRLSDEVKQHIKDCMEELGITQEEHDKALRDNAFDENPKFLCMPECVMRTTEIMIDKEINLDNLKEMVHEINPDIPEDQVEKINEKCMGEAEGHDEKCDFVMKYEICLMGEIS